MRHKISLGISSCPNDTFIFGAALRGDIEHNFDIELTMDDVQQLNNLAIESKLDVTKVSFGVYPQIADNYKILKSGGALGFGCGPLVLSSKYKNIGELKGKRLAIPGANTTAFMVFRSFFPECATDVHELRFDKIMPALERGEFDAGLVIHEGRFTYQNYNLNKVADMGEVWEKEYNCPIPLGFIAIRKDKLGYADEINDMIKKSLDFAWKNEDKTYKYAKQFAVDMQDDVLKSHVSLYVNEYSYDLTKACDAISKLLKTDESVFI